MSEDKVFKIADVAVTAAMAVSAAYVYITDGSVMSIIVGMVISACALWLCCEGGFRIVPDDEEVMKNEENGYNPQSD